LKPIGVFGGRFDPIHYGHLRTAFELLQALNFEEIRFMPCGNPPHRDQAHANAEFRFEMVAAAIEGQHGFVVDDRELSRKGPSYSVDSLNTLRTDFPLRSIALIIGMDAFIDLPKWHQWQEILQLSHIVVAHRPGWRLPDMGPLGELLTTMGTHRVDDLHEAKSGHIYIHDVTQLEISSSEIRELISLDRIPRFLMPDSVCEIIKRTRCY
jgi:nicotinate-nucleotide adenylyltransferase